MPIADGYVDAALNAVVSSWPASGAKYRLYSSNPNGLADPTTVELTATGGYAAVTFTPGGWASASGNAKATTAPVSFGTSTAAYSDVATYWGIEDTGGVLVFSNDLSTSIAVDASGVAVSFTPTLSFGDS